MPNDDDTKQQGVVVQSTGGVPTSVPLGQGASIDLSWLPEDERKALLTDYARGVLDVGKKAHELHLDANVLKKNLDTLAGTTKSVAEDGNAITLTHTQSTSIGRTEVVMGNTQQAQSGRLSRSQAGLPDHTLWYVIAALIALVIIASIYAR